MLLSICNYQFPNLLNSEQLITYMLTILSSFPISPNLLPVPSKGFNSDFLGILFLSAFLTNILRSHETHDPTDIKPVLALLLLLKPKVLPTLLDQLVLSPSPSILPEIFAISDR